MRPLSLQIEGFTCFSEKVCIDFAALDVFAITGRTGSGKTTIMDAICYALYGKVPRGTDPSALVAHDCQKLMVSFEFEADKERYRIARTVTLAKSSGKPTSKLQFEQLVDAEADAWQPLEIEGSGVKAVNSALEQVIGLDYETFKRTVMLPQGQFQEMLSGDNAKRRDVLEELLDVGIYETVRKRANAESMALKQQAEQLDGLLDTQFGEATDEALAACKRELADAGPALEQAKVEKTSLGQARDLANALTSARKEEKQRRATAEAKQAEATQAERIAQTGAEELARLQKSEADAAAALEAAVYDGVEHTKLAAARGIAQQAEARAAQAAAAQATAADRAPVDAAAEAERAAATASEEASASAAEAEEALRAGEREDAAAHVRSQVKVGDPCPVCGETVRKLPKGAAPKLDALQKAATGANKKRDDAVKAAQAAAQRLALARQQLDQAVADAAKLETEAAALEKELTAALPKGAPRELAKIDALLKEMTVAQQRRDAAVKALDACKQAREQHQQTMADSKEAVARLKAELNVLLEQADNDRKRGDDSIAALRQIVEACGWTEIGVEIDDKRDPRPTLDAMLKDADDECGRLQQEIGRLETKVQTIQQSIEQAAELRKQRDAVREDAALHGTLADLLKANHFMDWYVSEAMRQLAEAATYQLETLDPERRYELGVKGSEFEVRDAWQGGATRPPGTLSGGETFVVSLALALGLAEQLPQIQATAGRALESLFLDEGFGTLDSDTLNPVITAIQGLHSKGRMVGIITHVRDLAEMLPRRIEVVKAQGGSTIRVA
jgi:exonuclease SbcC